MSCFVTRKTAYELRISDLSSDVCSSDLPQDVAGALQVEGTHHACGCYQYGGELRPSLSELQHVPGRELGEQAGFRLAHREGLGRCRRPCHRHPPEGRRHRAYPVGHPRLPRCLGRSEEHTSELQSLMRISYAVFCLNKHNSQKNINAAVP